MQSEKNIKSKVTLLPQVLEIQCIYSQKLQGNSYKMNKIIQETKLIKEANKNKSKKIFKSNKEGFHNQKNSKLKMNSS